MSALTAELLLSDLQRVPLLSSSQLRRVEEAVTRGSHTPGQLISRLVEKGWLTRFQGDTLVAGKAKSLIVGPYLLLELLGEGGMGRVYKARHARIGRVDAVKVIRADKLASQTLARRFAREIRLTATLQHPHIVRAFDAGEHGSQLYLATEFIAGEDLSTTVRRHGPLSAADVCQVGYQACLALQCIHDRGLVHRDVKPSNLMRETATKAIKLLDLGLSGVGGGVDGASLAGGSLTADGVMLGTPDFMSPEQARDPHGADIRADLYSLGGTLFFLLAGRPPYTGTAVEKLIAHGTAPVPRLEYPTGPVPPLLAAIVTRLLAKRPEDRFPLPMVVAAEFLALRPSATPIELSPLTDIQSETIPEARSAGVAESGFSELTGHAVLPPVTAPAGRPTRRARWSLAALGVTVGVAVVAAVVATGRNRNAAPPDDPPPSASAHPLPTDELRDLRGAVAGTEDRTAVRQRVLEYRARHAGTPQATVAAGLLRRLPSPLDRLVTPPGSAFVQASALGLPVARVAFSPDDTRLVITRIGRSPDELTLPDLTSTGRFSPVPLSATAVVSVTPDGSVAAGVGPGGTLVFWEGGRARTVEADPPFVVRGVSVAADGKSAVVIPAEPDSKLTRIELPGGKRLGEVEVGAVGVRNVTVAPDGGHCVVTGDDGAVRVVPLPAGQPVRTIDPVPKLPTAPAGVFGPDGGRLYLVGVEHAASRFPAGAGRSDLRYEVPQNPLLARLTGIWKVAERTPRPTCVGVSADEAAVAVGTGEGRLVVFAAATGAPTHDITLPGGVRTLGFSTHGRVLAAALEGGRVVVIPLGK
jgi:serine/threonine protein kinase